MNHKKFLTLQEQINCLERKNIYVPPTKFSERILRDTNYYNLISCSKVKFAIGKNITGKYLYSPSHFRRMGSIFQKRL